MEGKENIIAHGELDVTEEYLAEKEAGVVPNPLELLKRLREIKVNNDMPDELNGVIIALRVMRNKIELNGDMVAYVTDDDISKLTLEYNKYQKTKTQLEDFIYKRKSVNMLAGNLLKKILKTRHESLIPGKTSLGISRDDGVLYIGKTPKVHAEPEAPANVLMGDRIIGKLTSSEKTKIQTISSKIQYTEEQVKYYQTLEREARLSLMHLYFDILGADYFKALMNSGKHFEDVELVINLETKSVRCCDVKKKRG